MGRVISLKGRTQQRKLPKEFSPEEEALVSELYKKLMVITDKYHDVVTCKAVAVFMGTLMMKTNTPGTIIGGFMGHIETVANVAIAQHRKLEIENAPKVLGTKHPEGVTQDPAQVGQPGAEDPGTPQGSDRDLEGQGPEVLLPPTLQ